MYFHLTELEETIQSIVPKAEKCAAEMFNGNSYFSLSDSWNDDCSRKIERMIVESVKDATQELRACASQAGLSRYAGELDRMVSGIYRCEQIALQPIQ